MLPQTESPAWGSGSDAATDGAALALQTLLGFSDSQLAALAGAAAERRAALVAALALHQMWLLAAPLARALWRTPAAGAVSRIHNLCCFLKALVGDSHVSIRMYYMSIKSGGLE